MPIINNASIAVATTGGRRIKCINEDNRGCGECEIENTPSAELSNANDRSFGQSPIFPQPPAPSSPSVVPSSAAPSLYSIGPRPLAATFLHPSHEKCLLCIFLRTTEKRIVATRVHMYEQSYGYVTDATCQICRFAFQNGTTPEAVANNDNVRPSSDYLRHLNRMPLLLRLSKRYTDQNNNSTRVNFILR